MTDPDLQKRQAEPRKHRTHQLKIRPPFFDDVRDGEKTFEYRKAERGFAVGDYLQLREYDKGAYTGRECWRKITYILDVNKWAKEKYVCMAMVPLSCIEYFMNKA